MTDRFSNRTGSHGFGPVATPGARFCDPDRFYAPHFFWFWNSACELNDPRHFATMAQGIASQGLNPGYVHARHYKAQTPFWLSDDWYDCFQAAVESTEQAGAFMSYTMGDPCFPDKYLLPDHPEYPRFPVGGAPLPRHPELKSVSLCWTTLDVRGGETVEIPNCFFAVAARLDAAGRLISATLQILEAPQWTAPQGGTWRVYLFAQYHEVCQYRINFLDRRLAAPWLALENDKYEQRLSRHFGKTMKGVFFDLEGSFGHKIAWSDDLAADYLKLKGVDIRLRMPLLVEEDAEGLWAKARWDWFDVVGRVYVDCVFAPLERWCRQRGMFMTCHFWEERLFIQAVYVADFMRAQRSYSMPGTDALFQTIHNPRYFKETQSVCEFEGRPFMCEVLGIAGWHVTPAELKAAANSATAHGLTHLVPHGVNSSRDLRQASYPPDFLDWNPYWRHVHLWSDFVRRASHVNDHGRLAAEVLLLCPMDSVWALIGDAFFDRAKPQPHLNDASDVELAHGPEITAIDDAYSKAMADLYAGRIDHLIADSHYLEKMTVSGAALVYGAFAFKALVLPPLRLLPLGVARRILDFARAGGHVYALGSLPDASAEKGVGDLELKRLMDALRQARSFVAAKDGLAPLIAAAAPGLEPCVSFESGAFPLIASRREINGRGFFWLANNGDVRREFVLRVKATGEASVWNCETGDAAPVPSETVAGGSRVALALEPYEAYWLVFDPAALSAEQEATKPQSTSQTGEQHTRLSGSFALHTTQPPALTRMEGERPREPIVPEPRWAAGSPHYWPVATQPLLTLDGPWTVGVDPADQPSLAQHKLAAPEWLLQGGATRSLESWLNWELRQFSGFVDYGSSFRLAQPAGTEFLDLGLVKHMAEVWVNGEHAGTRLWPPFRFAIGKWLRPGENTLRIRVGNLIVNAVTQYENYSWKWYQPPTAEMLDAGLFGPVTVLRPTALAQDEGGGKP